MFLIGFAITIIIYTINRKVFLLTALRFLFSDPSGARTQDPNIKSVVLYQLS